MGKEHARGVTVIIPAGFQEGNLDDLQYGEQDVESTVSPAHPTCSGQNQQILLLAQWWAAIVSTRTILSGNIGGSSQSVTQGR